MIIYQNPNFLYLLLILIPIIAWYVWKRKKTTANLQMSTTEAFTKVSKSYKYYLLHVPFALRIIVLALLIIVLARPQSSDKSVTKDIEGIDIMITLDISSSMLAEDLTPNRIEAAKAVASEFVSGRNNDNIGLVVYSGESFTLCPLTSDKATLVNLINSANVEMIEVSNTAIGNGLATAVNRIKDSQTKSKVIILLTDGSNNAGEIDPIVAADIAKTYGIRVYTIAIGKKGLAPYPFETMFGIQRQMVPVEIDENMLKEIAKITDGHYFRATDNNSLKEIYKEIDQLEKTKIQVKELSNKEEEYLPIALAALFVFLVEILLRNTILRHIS